MHTSSSLICQSDQDISLITNGSRNIITPLTKPLARLSIVVSIVTIVLASICHPPNLQYGILYLIVQLSIFTSIYYCHRKQKNLFLSYARDTYAQKSCATFTSSSICIESTQLVESEYKIVLPWNSVDIRECKNIWIIKTTVVTQKKHPVYLILLKKNLSNAQTEIIQNILSPHTAVGIQHRAYDYSEEEQSKFTKVVPYIQNDKDEQSFLGLLDTVFRYRAVLSFIFMVFFLFEFYRYFHTNQIHLFQTLYLLVFFLAFDREMQRNKKETKTALNKQYFLYFGYNKQGIVLIKRGSFYYRRFLLWESLKKKGAKWKISQHGIFIIIKKQSPRSWIPLPWFLTQKGIPVEWIAEQLNKHLGKPKKIA